MSSQWQKLTSRDLSYKDRHWHNDCFQCFKCKRSIADKPFSIKDERLLCTGCYANEYSSKCHECKKSIMPVLIGTKKMEHKGNSQHETCFTCQRCQQPIGTESFIPKDNSDYCMPCFIRFFTNTGFFFFFFILDPTNPCQTDVKGLPDMAETCTTPSSRDCCADGQVGVNRESPAHGEPIRTQPQSGDGEATRLHNGLHPGMSNGHRTPPGTKQPAVLSDSFSETRKPPPPPVSQRVQKKLRSSLSVNSDSSRRSKGSSTGSHKPGSSPE
ncbi:four and a half LIM domains protein 2, partial [Clarias magur]